MKTASRISAALLALVLLFVLSLTGCQSEPSLCIRQAYYHPDTVAVGTVVELSAGQIDLLDDCDRPPPPNVVWSSSAPTVATISESGVLKALSTGRVDAIARSDRVTARWSIVVVDP
jgi:hypothetical protein